MRTKDTFELIRAMNVHKYESLYQNPVFDKRIRETFLGSMEGKTKDEVIALEKQYGLEEGDLITCKKIDLLGGESL